MGLKEQASLRAKYGIGLAHPFLVAGAPTNNVTRLGTAVVGSQLIDTTNGKLYVCTATNGTSTITWTVTGSQTGSSS
jgi:hypothetical protein